MKKREKRDQRKVNRALEPMRQWQVVEQEQLESQRGRRGKILEIMAEDFPNSIENTNLLAKEIQPKRNKYRATPKNIRSQTSRSQVKKKILRSE